MTAREDSAGAFAQPFTVNRKITSAGVRADFNAIESVLHYTRAAHELGLWQSELLLIARFFPDRAAPLLELGCGAGRATLGLWALGYHRLIAIDFAEELIDQARSLAATRGADGIIFLHADATRLPSGNQWGGPFSGALFLFNGLMQIPGRENRRAALREIHRVCRPGAPLLFTTHDREDSPRECARWAAEAARWAAGTQDPCLIEFGDCCFTNEENGRTFMHLPDRAEILADLVATGWTPVYDAMRRELARESRAVRDFADECRFWMARKT